MNNYWLKRSQTKKFIRAVLELITRLKESDIDPWRYDFNHLFDKYPRVPKISNRQLLEHIRKHHGVL